MSVGRNDPCPCGSGKKYKRCCLPNQVPDADELLWQQVHETHNSLLHKLLEHVAKTYGPVAVHEGWDAFHLWRNEEPFEFKSPQVPLFFPWFFYHWLPEPDSTEVIDEAPLDLTPVESLLQSKRYRLSDLEVEYLEDARSRAFSFFEVLEVKAGSWMKVKDVFTEELHTVMERTASRSAKVGHILFTRVITVRDLSTFDGMAPIVFPPEFKIGLIGIRRDWREKGVKLTQESLRERDMELLHMYWDYFEDITHPPPPILHNTDGELLVPHKMIFKIASAEAAFDALHALCIAETRKELLERARFYKSGTLRSVDFPWLKKGNKKHKGWDNTVMGHIHIDGKKMTVEVNSEKRSKKFLTLLKKKMPEGWTHQATHIEELDLSKIRKAGGSNRAEQEQEQEHEFEHERVRVHEHEHEELMQQPEIQARLARMSELHWEAWPLEPLPALGGQTPVEAIKSTDGREAVDALITQFEHRAKVRPQPGQTVETFQRLRERLGL